MKEQYKGSHEEAFMERQAQDGFTLLEVIVAISILMFGILAVASMQSSSIQGNALSRDMSIATGLAADRVEKIVTRPYTHADLAATTGTPHTIATPAPNARFTLAWNVTDNTDGTLIADTKTVEVTVSWTEHGVPKSYRVVRIVPRFI